MKKNKIITAIFIIIIIYSFLSIFRSLGLLYLSFSDSYFQNFNFNLESDLFIEKFRKYQKFYFYYPYVIGIVTIPFLKKWYTNTRWYIYIIYCILAIVIFRLIDASVLRPLFAIFINTRVNIIIQLILFLTIAICGIFYNRKLVIGQKG
jgi:hypothetical protein